MTKSNGSHPSAVPTKGSLAEELVMMAKLDQRMRRRGTYDPNVDEHNTARLKEIVGEIGWPTISKVGRTASDCAWLLVQHADNQIGFQRQCLELMRRAGSDVAPQNLAYLEDRIRIHDGRPQVYGTQVSIGESGEIVAPALADPESVDDRRSRMGLGPLADYLEDLKKVVAEGIPARPEAE